MLSETLGHVATPEKNRKRKVRKRQREKKEQREEKVLGVGGESLRQQWGAGQGARQRRWQRPEEKKIRACLVWEAEAVPFLRDAQGEGGGGQGGFHRLSGIGHSGPRLALSPACHAPVFPSQDTDAKASKGGPDARCSLSRFCECRKFRLISWLMEKAAEFLLRGAFAAPYEGHRAAVDSTDYLRNTK